MDDKLRNTIEKRINRIMVGRYSEMEMFKKQFDHVLEGGMGLTIVSGRPGIGKTFFVDRAVSLAIGGNATCLRGKFRQYDSKPLIAVAEVIEQAVRYILTLPTESLKHIKYELLQKQGVDPAVILAICPYAEKLLGSRKAINIDSLDQLKYRVKMAVCYFFETVCTALFPLIIFLDDLQWADAVSINIIEDLCEDHEYLNLHLVLAYREGDTGQARLNQGILSEGGDILIELGGLNYEDIDQYIRLIFEQNIEHKDYLTRILYGLTLGSPFNMSRILRLLLQEGALTYSPTGPKWLLWHDKIEKLNLPADIEQLLTTQIDGLQEEDKALLRLIACCGGEVRLGLLKRLTDPEEALSEQLDRLCQKNLLVKIFRESEPDKESNGYSFAHDIVLKLVYNSIVPEEKSKTHYRIAGVLSALIEKTLKDEAVAAHLLKVDRDLLVKDNISKWIDILYRAGLAARQGAAVEQALEIFELCAELLSFDEQKAAGKLLFDVRLELGECQYICGQAKEAGKSFETLMAEYPATEYQVRIKRKYINLCAFKGDFEKVLALGHEILDHLDFKFGPGSLIPDLILSRLLLNSRKIRRLKDEPAITDERLLVILETLTVMAPSANRIGDRMSALIALKLAILSARRGKSDYTPVAYASYSYVLFHIFKDYKKGRELEDVTLTLLEKSENAASKYTALCIIGSLTRHWMNSLEDTVACLERSVMEGEKADASLYSSYAVSFIIITKYLMGAPLKELKQYFNNNRKKQKRLEHYLTNHIYDIYENHIRRLEEGIPPEADALAEKNPLEADPEKRLFANTIKLNEDMIRLQRLYLEGEIREAYLLSDSVGPKVSLHRGFALNVEFIFYSILARLAVHRDLAAAERRRNKKIIKKYLSQLKFWVRTYPGNHYARCLLAQAEYDAQFNRGKSAAELYREAMEFAQRQGNLALEALANLLAAKYHRNDRKLSGFYASEAAGLYRKWGAFALADAVAEAGGRRTKDGKEEVGRWDAGKPGYGAARVGQTKSGAADFPAAAKNPAGPTEAAAASETPSAAEAYADGRDILFHLGRIETMDEDEGYLYLFDLLIRRGDADYCAVFFEKTEDMYLKYEQRKTSGPQIHREPINMNHLSGLPHKIIRYAARTETEILPGTEVRTGLFANEPYLAAKERISLTCLPLRYAGVLAGIIYLEKTGGEGLDGSLPSFVKGFTPALLSKKGSGGGFLAELKPESPIALKTEDLTGRELEVLKLVAEGMSNSEISEKLYITLGTVRNHLSSIYAKLEVNNRVKAVMRAKELKIIHL